MREKALDREEANRAAGLMGAADADKRKRQSYAFELEEQMRIKKVCVARWRFVVHVWD